MNCGTKLSLNHRFLIRKDLPRVLEIEKAALKSHAWSEKDFIQVMRLSNTVSKVAEDAFGKIYGYVIYQCNDHSWDILSMAVDPEHQWQGVGGGMLRYVQSKMYDKRPNVFALVSEYATDVQKFFSHAGFKAVEVIRGAYDNPEEAGYLFWTGLYDTPSVKRDSSVNNRIAGLVQE